MSLYLACGLTMAIETAYFYLAGFKDRYFLIVCLTVNAATNLTMNLVLSCTGISLWSVLIAEILVTGTEYAVYSLITKTSRKKLLGHSSITTTGIYANMDLTDQIRAVAKLNFTLQDNEIPSASLSED